MFKFGRDRQVPVRVTWHKRGRESLLTFLEDTLRHLQCLRSRHGILLAQPAGHIGRAAVHTNSLFPLLPRFSRPSACREEPVEECQAERRSDQLEGAPEDVVGQLLRVATGLGHGGAGAALDRAQR